MKPEEIGRRFGIGVRVAGRIARQRVEGHTGQAATAPPPGGPAWQGQAAVRGKSAGRAARAAGRGVAGFLKPFGRVGGILWLEVTGFFFGLFAAGFAFRLWQVRQGYTGGPQRPAFLIAAGLTLVFAYLCVSAFWRAGRK